MKMAICEIISQSGIAPYPSLLNIYCILVSCLDMNPITYYRVKGTASNQEDTKYCCHYCNPAIFNLNNEHNNLFLSFQILSVQTCRLRLEKGALIECTYFDAENGCTQWHLIDLKQNLTR